ncbi:MAG: ClC family H(+)/Cl(-) exchange transporter [Spirochaetaceae bacterium]|jgi:H+/Cl- antiporter ClcA|nr:ClC family H(+)/Cl(-) exchange transporter [Spirochaetaceae bacterium]
MKKEQEHQIEGIMREWYGSRLAVIIESIVIGCSTGFVIVLFRLALGKTDKLRLEIYKALPAMPVKYTVFLTLTLAAAGLLLGLANVVRPMVSGGGVSQIKGVMQGLLREDWKVELPLKWAASFLAISTGLSFGWEGPSVMLAAYTGLAVLQIFKRPDTERNTLLASSSAAGLSAAFNAPLAGVLFMLEEMRVAITPLSIACAMGASMAGDVVAGHFFGLQPVYHFRSITVMPVRFFLWILLLGVTCAFLGDLFKRALYASQDFFKVLRIPVLFRPVIPVLISIPLSFYLYDVTGSGHPLIDSLSTTNRPVNMLLLILFVNLLYSSFCAGSGASGGIFLPIITCGALAGDAFGKALTEFGLVGAEYQLNFMILGMAAMFSAVIKAPVTGIVLVLEMTANYNHLASLVLVSLCAFVTAELISSRPVYDVLLTRILSDGVSPRIHQADNKKGG